MLLFILQLVVSKNFSVSGISSGAFLSVQLQVAYSSEVIGAGIVAGGPYYCALNNAATALTECMYDPTLLTVEPYIDAAYYQQGILTIDDLSNLSSAKIYIYSGTKDSVVKQKVGQVAYQFFQEFVEDDNIMTDFDTESEHAFITNDYGNECSYLGSPYINNCSLDQAEIILTHIYGNLNPKVEQIPSNLKQFDQSQYIVAPLSSMDSTGYIYIPTNCQNQDCDVHVALHGCLMGIQEIGTSFVENAGYNEWAESNNIIILYPQAVKEAVLNPNGCWDWWGYTGIYYAVKEGTQMRSIYDMVQNLPISGIDFE